jgi:hypothetical protein
METHVGKFTTLGKGETDKDANRRKEKNIGGKKEKETRMLAILRRKCHMKEVESAFLCDQVSMCL